MSEKKTTKKGGQKKSGQNKPPRMTPARFRMLLKTDKHFRMTVLRKGVALLMIFACAIFVIANHSKYYNTVKDKGYLSDDAKSGTRIVTAMFPTGISNTDNGPAIDMRGSKTVRQTIRGFDGKVTRMRFMFYNTGSQGSTGTVTFNLLNSDGSNILTVTKDAQRMNTYKYTNIDIPDGPTLSADKEYILEIISDNVQNPQRFDLGVSMTNRDLYKSLTLDGNEIADHHIKAHLVYQYYNKKTIPRMLLVLFIAFAFVSIPFTRFDAELKQKYHKPVNLNRIMTVIFSVATPFFCMALADRFQGYKFLRILHRFFTWSGFFNLIIYLLIFAVFYAIFNRAKYASICSIIVTFVFGLTNYYVWNFRGVPVLATDISSIGTAMNVAGNFSYALDATGIWAVVYIVAMISMFMSLKSYSVFHKWYRLISLACIVLLLFGGNRLFLHSTAVKDKGIIANVWQPWKKYDTHGIALSFLLSCTYNAVEKPSDYSVKYVEKLTKDYEPDQVTGNEAKDEKMPNVIAIMNESLGDLNFDGNLPLSEDYLPYIHSLNKNTIKGKLHVSIEGANTANSEFEFLTGNSMTFLPFRSIPYDNYIKSPMPSLTYTLKAMGYSGVNAYHPYKASGWNRTVVYPLLGFNNCFFQDHYGKNAALVRNFISDEADFEDIIKEYEANKKQTSDAFYLFNVTMQNHGGYYGNRGFVDTPITITDSSLKDSEAEQFINLAKLSDSAFQMLTEYFAKQDDPTVIVMFGDHQPPLSTEFYSKLFGKNTGDLTPEQNTTWYSTPYVIWANYDIGFKDNEDMSANYLSSYLLDLIGGKLTGYNKYLLDLRKDIPFISAAGYEGSDGKIYKADKKSDYSKEIKQYQNIQYNNMFDTDHRVKDFFFVGDDPTERK